MTTTGFSLQIVNATPHDLKLIGQSKYQMGWAPVDRVRANDFAQFYSEFDQGAFTYSIDDAADAIYVLDGVEHFEVRIHVAKNGVNNLPSPYPPSEAGYGFSVEWVGVPPGYAVYPPRDGSNHSPVGWIHDGVVTIAIGYFPGFEQKPLSAYPVPVYGPDGTTSDWSALRSSVKHWSKNWMEAYSVCLQNLTIPELTLPGTHDAGTYAATGVSQQWVQTQYLSLQEQLEQGIRALDIRLRIDGSGTDRFQFCHGDYLTNLSYKDGLGQVLGFLAEVRSELVILDYHRFEGDWSEADFHDLAALTQAMIGDLQIPRSASAHTVSELLGQPGRVVVGMGQHSGGAITDGVRAWLRDNTTFWADAVEQYWAGTSVAKWGTIAGYMQQQLDALAKPRDHVWALMSQYNYYAPGPGMPANAPVEISNFFAGKNGLRANVISTDWWNRVNSTPLQLETDIPNFSALISAVPMNLLKGYRANNDLPLF
ncbi:hypothetical protein [Methylobacterium platani]|uniref:Phosphatidylinositol diacylglycerol-lyase n=2 Tax=Methylobacterium platani TaxID=427683 RepID=A0A179SCU6_9HYPH|nr:hypothetical protein [Methylobacterium platani]KMO17802.1 hypothetical protein SQ03_11715 [Methylobacterium platani JCM 14648]OAS25457.1 hypothetical protein A5481_08810 [Methylobacterium platani]